ncbi:MAG TPA: recombination protein O N-terminal domain-containing protein [Candidatus Paceibacterota bacterium]|nr:recombination protein O N-terminal domain-containing protein [Candidatus Paceibacterota bacterium]
MRHKYETHGLVLARSHTGEANTFVTMMTPDLGLVYARAQSLRKHGAKLAASLVTFAESDVVLVRGKEGWRVTGAVLNENWFQRLRDIRTRSRAARVSGLLLRLVVGEVPEEELYPIMRGFLAALVECPVDMHEAIEILVVLRVLATLGLDTGEIPGEKTLYTTPVLAEVKEHRLRYISRINIGLSASGL